MAVSTLVVAAKHSALQHELQHRLPRPLPLFLAMVHRLAQSDPALARNVLRGVESYRLAPRRPAPERAVALACGRARLLAHGAVGPPVVLVPSLINPASVLDLDSDRSLLGYIGDAGYRAMLLDWGVPGSDDSAQDIAGHIEQLLLPLLATIGEPVHLVGYCLGGTMALAAAALRPVRSLTMLATPWHFARYPADAATALAGLWQQHRDTVDALGVMPVELLQTAFWGIDPDRTLAKYAALADGAADRAAADGSADGAADLAAFVALEDWANDGAPLTAAAAHDLFEHFIAADDPGGGRWRVGGMAIAPERLTAPALQLTACNDRIAPAPTASGAIRAIACPSGHVGMVVGRRARAGCWQPLLDWIALH